jgi:superfamily I DNA/RNA helicase/mRNA-degrading endonuclease RelE of RelBE toxin-antitoxin system
VNFIIADTFYKSLDRLPANEQAAVKQAAFDFQMNPKSPGFSYEDVKGAKDRDLWSFRASDGLRVIVHRSPATFTLCYVGRHDDAYRWAEKRKIEFHPITGAAQIVEVIERTEEHVRRIVRDEIVEPPAFRRYERSYLHALGVPEEWLDAVLHAVESELDTLLPRLPQEAAERLLELACGNPVPVPGKSDRTGFEHPDAQRRFKVIESEDELRRALDASWEQWMVFLHPSQRKTVIRNCNGPARVSGAAGTGKTVVALHRTAELARRYPNARILLTTFSKTLALRLAVQARTLIGPDAPELSRIRVEHLHKVARDVVASRSGAVNVLEGPALTQLFADANDSGLDSAFLKAEWESIIDPLGIETWEEYRALSRSNRGVSIGAKQRQAAWKVFEKALVLMRQRRLLTWDKVCLDAASAVPLFDNIIADEFQDFGTAEMRFLRAAVKPGPDDLFLCGDSGQRIYKPACSWLSLGIDIRGRSTNLKLNYRTTEQIRRFADRIVASELQGGTGESEARLSVSLLQGPPPEIRVAASHAEEIEFVASWLRELVASGVQQGEIAVFARSDHGLKNLGEAAVRKAGLSFRSLRDDDASGDAVVSVGTMHRAKGLEFRAVAVVGCDDRALPLESVLGSLSDPADRTEFSERERQLLYVACTRARERLLVTAAGRMSSFVPVGKAGASA